MRQSGIKSSFKQDNGREYYRLKNGTLIPAAKYIYQSVYGKVSKECDIHHEDGNCWNDCLYNLRVMTKVDHIKYHKSHI